MKCHFCNSDLIISNRFSTYKSIRYYCDNCVIELSRQRCVFRFIIDYNIELEAVHAIQLCYFVNNDIDNIIYICSDFDKNHTKIYIKNETIDSGLFTDDIFLLENKVNRITKLLVFL